MRPTYSPSIDGNYNSLVVLCDVLNILTIHRLRIRACTLLGYVSLLSKPNSSVSRITWDENVRTPFLRCVRHHGMLHRSFIRGSGSDSAI